MSLLNKYVELLPDCEQVYARAVAGSRGTIRACETDDYEFEKVYIEWDKAHWRYNEEPDGWTFASHFKPVEGELQLVGEGAEIESEAPCPDCGHHHPDETHVEKYVDDIMSGFEQAAESDGFLLITMQRRFDPELGAEVVILNTHRGSAIDDLNLIAEADIFRFIEDYKRRKGE